jgi:hypothetical protein
MTSSDRGLKLAADPESTVHHPPPQRVKTAGGLEWTDGQGRQVLDDLAGEETVADPDRTSSWRSSQLPLEGERAPITIMLEFRGLPSGEYRVAAIPIDSSGHRRAVTQRPVSIIDIYSPYRCRQHERRWAGPSPPAAGPHPASVRRSS